MWCLLTKYLIQRSSATTGLMVDASLKEQLTVGVSSLLVVGACHTGYLLIERKKDS